MQITLEISKLNMLKDTKETNNYTNIHKYI